MKDSIPPSADHMAVDIKNLQVGIAKFKAENAIIVAEIKDMVQKESSKYKLKAMEDRIMFR